MIIKFIKAEWEESIKKTDVKIEETWCCNEAKKRILIDQRNGKPFITSFVGYGAHIDLYLKYCPFCGDKILIEEIKQNKPIR